MINGEDISNILSQNLCIINISCFNLLNDVKLKASDEEVLEDLRLENDIEYKFDLVEEDAFERGKNQGINKQITTLFL